jgi:hypothetical protein
LKVTDYAICYTNRGHRIIKVACPHEDCRAAGVRQPLSHVLKHEKCRFCGQQIIGARLQSGDDEHSA